MPEQLPWYERLTFSPERVPQLIQQIPDIIRNPAAYPVQAAILLGIALVLVLIVILTVVLIIMRPPRDEEEFLEEVELTEDERDRLEAVMRTQRRRAFFTVASAAVLMWLAFWIVTGVTTGHPRVCTDCHRDTIHNVAETDPHEDVACVKCHETGGPGARLTVNVFTRLEHVVMARYNRRAAQSFGKPSASDGCLECHRDEIDTTYVDQELQVKVSHKEPLEAGAQCVDCHTLHDGVVSSVTVGMSPCLRCHDGKQVSADCDVCHIGDPSQAIRTEAGPDEMAKVQVDNPRCDGCHKDMTTCDACHGIRMPHSDVFTAYGHARPGAIDIWDNNQQTCSKCHYTGHRSCQASGCHDMKFPSHPSPVWKTLHGKTTWSDSYNTCACHDWNPFDRNGVNYCQICHPTKPAGARP